MQILRKPIGRGDATVFHLSIHARDPHIGSAAFKTRSDLLILSFLFDQPFNYKIHLVKGRGVDLKSEITE